MAITVLIKKIVRDHPVIAAEAYKIARKFWSLKANFIQFDKPGAGASALNEKQLLEYNKNRIFGPRKKVCYAPFNNLHFRTDGTVAACSFNLDHKIGDIKEESITAIWNSERMNAFREMLSKADLSKCGNCLGLLRKGNYESAPPSKYDWYSTESSDWPTQMSFEISNRCNLECIMCTGEYSSSIQLNREKVPCSPYVYPKDFPAQLHPFLPHLKTVSFIGGEPTMIPVYYEIWENLIASNDSCEIHVQTNAVHFNSKFWELLESGQFSIGISMDAVTPTLFESIRVNASYKRVLENIEKLTQLKNRGKVHLNINFCAMAVNLHELPAMLQFCNERGLSLKIVNVDSPTNLSLSHQKPFFFDQLKNNLSSLAPPGRGNVIAIRNYRTCEQFMNTVNAYHIEAIHKEERLKSLINLSLAELLNLLREEIEHNQFYRFFDGNQKTDLLIKLTDYFAKIPANKNTVMAAELLIYSSSLKGNMLEDKSIEDCFNSFVLKVEGWLARERNPQWIN
ncbi:MAG: SPASM domain-containing protein [Chitinophagales bacterium]